MAKKNKDIDEKIQKKYIDYEFGFPVEIRNVTMRKIREKWVPMINLELLSDLLFQVLAKKPVSLTGNELKFIRHKFELNLQQFGEKFYVSHAAVLKWEKCGNEPTKMCYATEKDIRLSIAANTEQKGDFKAIYKLLRPKTTNMKRKNKFEVKDNELVPA